MPVYFEHKLNAKLSPAPRGWCSWIWVGNYTPIHPTRFSYQAVARGLPECVNFTSTINGFLSFKN